MAKSKKVLTCYIGSQDIYEWVTSDDGKKTMMPILIEGCESIIDKDLEEKKVLVVESIQKYASRRFSFYVRKEEMEETLGKIMDWALENEEYEICARVKKIEDNLVKETF